MSSPLQIFHMVFEPPMFGTVPSLSSSSTISSFSIYAYSTPVLATSQSISIASIVKITNPKNTLDVVTSIAIMPQPNNISYTT